MEGAGYPHQWRCVDADGYYLLDVYTYANSCRRRPIPDSGVDMDLHSEALMFSSLSGNVTSPTTTIHRRPHRMTFSEFTCTCACCDLSFILFGFILFYSYL